jgi:hypothetical protein
MVRSWTGFHPDRAARQAAEEWFDFVSSQLTSLNDVSIGTGSVDLEHRFR